MKKQTKLNVKDLDREQLAQVAGGGDISNGTVIVLPKPGPQPGWVMGGGLPVVTVFDPSRLGIVIGSLQVRGF